MRLNIQTKLLGTFLIVILGAIGFAIFAMAQMNSIYQGGNYLATNTIPSIYGVDQLENKVSYYRRQEQQHILATSAQDQAIREANLAKTDSEIQALIKNYQENLISDATDKQNIDSIASQWQAYKTIDAPIIELSRANKDQDALTLLNGDASTKLTALESTLDQSSQYNQKLSSDQARSMKTTFDTSLYWSIGLMIAITLLALVLGLWQSNSISSAARQLVKIADGISHGEMEHVITINSRDEMGEIAAGFKQMIANIQTMVADANMLSKAAVEGKLATRADASKHQGDFRKIVQGVNDTLDAVIGPLNVAANYVDLISKGDIPAKITDTYNGDFNTIKNNLNQCIDVVNLLVADANMLSKAAVEGKLATRADASKHQGDFRKIVQGVNDTLDAVIGPLNVSAGYVDLISKGEIPEKIVDNYNGDFNTIKGNINSMLVYLEEMAQAAGQIAEGDLTAEVNPRSKKDVLGSAFSKMISNLNNTMAQTNAVTNQVVQAVEQVRSVSQDLSSNAQEQSAAVEEVASSVQETDSQVKASADHASMANQLVSQTAALASAGQVKMNSLSESINSISHSSQEISKIIKVIDDIAFQTNLLALNAAVEAARAGQYGKGFAVVAQEVRNLAERSAKAAKSTAELIEDSSRRVAEGVNMTGETAHSLNEIVQNVVKVKDLVGEIAAASDEQTKALNQISQAITQVSQGTQSNSSQSEELASTADELGGLADRLREEVDRFRLNANSDAALSLEQVQTSLNGRQKPASKAVAAKSNNRHKPEGIRNVDRDERGYGNF
jgi:methyl-accepting chemotaxis protein